MELDRKKILESHLETIQGLSSREYQQRVWVRGEGPECDDYTETICHFFDDGDPIINDYKSYNITENQLSSLLKLRQMLNEFNSKIRFRLGPNFLDSQEWRNIIVQAKEVLAAFNYR